MNWTTDFATPDEIITYTAINPNNVQQEEKIVVKVNDDKTFVINNIPIDAQQLAELGFLLFSLAARAGINDLDSCADLVEGFDIPIPTELLEEIS